MEDDEVRRKRLARLGAGGSAGSSGANAASSSAVSSSVAIPVSFTAPSTGEKSSSPLKTTVPTGLMPMDVDKTPPKQVATATQPSPIAVAVASPQDQQARFARWQHDTLQRVFRITLDPNERSGNVFLPGLASEFANKDASKPVLLNKDMIDQLLITRAAVPSPEPLFKYFVGCYKRLIKEDRDVRNLKVADLNDRLGVLDIARQIVVSYVGLAITEAEMFEQPPEVVEKGSLLLVPYVMENDGSSEDFLPVDFWNAFVARFENDGLEALFTPIVKAVVAEMRNTSLLGNFNRPLQAFTFLMRFKPIAEMVVKMPNWIPTNVNGREMETLSILGPFLRPSVFADDDRAVGLQYFPGDLSSLMRAQVENANSAMRSTLTLLQKGQTELLNLLLRISPVVKERLLEFLAVVINLNSGRSKMHVDEAVVSSDGFIINQTVSLLRLCEPFLDSKGPKAALIDPMYIHRNYRVDSSKETRLAMQEKEANEWAKEQPRPDGQPNFISECFWLTAYFLHLGVNRSIVKYTESINAIREIQRHIKDLERSRPWPPHQVQQYEVYLTRLKAQHDHYIRRQLCFDMQLQDSDLLGALFRFYNLMASVLLKMARGGGVGGSNSASSSSGSTATDASMVLPLSTTDVPKVFTALPEWVVEDLTEFCLFVCRVIPHQLRLAIFEDIFTLAALLLDQPAFIKNPYNRSKFVEILHFITPELREQLGGQSIPDLSYLLNTHPALLKFLVPSMLSFYQEVERTGDSHQFYEKWPIRHNIALILKFVWTNKTHHSNALAYASNIDNFIRFVNLLRNDTTYLLDESISKLKEIHNIQERMKNTVEWNAAPPNERQEAEKNLAMAERQVTSYMHLANETVNMLQYLTKDIRPPFLRPEIITYLTAMLNSNIAKLVGPQTTELKVENKEKYMFRPRELLAGLIDIYLHLDSPELIEAMANEGRFYRLELFVKAGDILRKFNLRPEGDVDHLVMLIGKVEDQRKNAKIQEEELGDVPDEFLDPITAEIMRDPVMLPSNNIVDRSTIVTHLLSDRTDPFNRQALTMDMVQPVEELRVRIEDFLRGNRSNNSMES